MLVLSRRIGESIVISNNIVIRVLEVSGSQVRLGIEAPKEVAVYRSETRMATQMFSSRRLVAGACDA